MQSDANSPNEILRQKQEAKQGENRKKGEQHETRTSLQSVALER
jgi:hypothetical protein